MYIVSTKSECRSVETGLRDGGYRWVNTWPITPIMSLLYAHNFPNYKGEARPIAPTSYVKRGIPGENIMALPPQAGPDLFPGAGHPAVTPPLSPRKK